ncbi:MAG TPA: polysaccharide biosynthesis C-terminal domain-containing protein [Flavisolibacter sp.]|jgi:O-antigen/teichoic acid export membrane protein|nr:polysaccharide biosynthesis C-terminal domain-containing protein [Flavisolibacter sp.]
MGAQQFFKSLSWLLLLNLLIKPAWIFLIDRRVQNIVGHEVYGTYFALFNLTYILLFIADAGLTNMLNQRLAAREALSVQQLLRLKFFLVCIYALCCTTIALLTGITDWNILLYLIVIHSLISLFVFLRGILTAAQCFKTDAFFSVLDKSLLLLLCAGPVYGLFKPITILLFLQLQTVSMATAVGSLAFYLWRRNIFVPGRKVSLQKIATWVLPFILLILLMATHNRLDAFLLAQLHPDGALQAGIYAMAYRLLDACSMLGYLTASFLLPFLSRNRREKDLIQHVVLFSRHGLLTFAVIALAFVALFVPWLQNLLYHSTDRFTNIVILLTMAALPAYYLVHIYGTALTAVGAFRQFIRILLITVAANIVLNLWLIPKYGALGCCIAALVSQYSCGIGLWITASQKLKIKPAAHSAALYLAAALIFGLVFYAGQKFTDNVWAIIGCIALLSCIFLLAGRNRIKKSFLPFLNKLHA